MTAPVDVRFLGDTLEPIRGTFRVRGRGAALPAGATAALELWREGDSAALVATSSLSVSSAGAWEHTPSGAQLATAGRWCVDVVVTQDGKEKRLRCPGHILVLNPAP